MGGLCSCSIAKEIPLVQTDSQNKLSLCLAVVNEDENVDVGAEGWCSAKWGGYPCRWNHKDSTCLEETVKGEQQRILLDEVFGKEYQFDDAVMNVSDRYSYDVYLQPPPAPGVYFKTFYCCLGDGENRDEELDSYECLLPDPCPDGLVDVPVTEPVNGKSDTYVCRSKEIRNQFPSCTEPICNSQSDTGMEYELCDLDSETLNMAVDAAKLDAGMSAEWTTSFIEDTSDDLSGFSHYLQFERAEHNEYGRMTDTEKYSSYFCCAKEAHD